MSQARGLADNSLVGEEVTRRCDMSQARGLADNSLVGDGVTRGVT